MGNQGSGGYGGISTMNQDQRQGRYHPHKNITRHFNYSQNEVQVVCLDCLQRWHHPRGDVKNVPENCAKQKAAGDA